MQTRVTRDQRRVWFPEDEKGEPDDRNPDDGFGGFIHHLQTVTFYYVTSDGKLPSKDGSNILEGYEARKKAKEDQIGKDWQQTFDLVFREFNLPIQKGGCGGVWKILEEKISQLEEPDFCLIGQKWRQLYGEKKRKEEEELDQIERQEKRKEINKIIQQICLLEKGNPKNEVLLEKGNPKNEVLLEKGKRRYKGVPPPIKFIKNPQKTPPAKKKNTKNFQEIVFLWEESKENK